METKIEIFKGTNKEKLNNHYGKKGYLALGVVTSGSCYVELNFGGYSLNIHDFIIINPHTKSNIKNYSDDFECYVLYVNTAYFEEIIFDDIPQLINITDLMQSDGIFHLNDNDFYFLIKSYQYIDYCLKQNKQRFFNDIIKHQFTSMIFWMLNILPQEESSFNMERSRQNDIAEKFLRSLKCNFHNEHKVEFYADDQYITPKYLSTVVKSATGSTVHDWINKYIILEAKAQLKSTGKTIQQIAIDLNFPNQSFFSKFFKKSTNQTPTEYRKSYPMLSQMSY